MKKDIKFNVCLSHLAPLNDCLAPAELRKVPEQHAQPNPSACLTRFLTVSSHPRTVVMILAVLIGGGTGMGVVTFHYLIELVTT